MSRINVNPPPPEGTVKPPPPPGPQHVTTAQVLRVKPGDKIIVSLPFMATPDMLEKIREQFAPIFPGNPILVLTEGMKIGVVRPSRRKA